MRFFCSVPLLLLVALAGCSGGDLGGSPVTAGGAASGGVTAASGGNAKGGAAAVGGAATGGHSGTVGTGGEPAGFRSCVGGGPGAGADCGPEGNNDCCASLLVPGGRFLRSYDGATYTNTGFPATVSSYSLDQYEVTVGRFRTFVSAWLAGYRPPAGSGRHTHLAGGGIVGETGWDAAWSTLLPTAAADWDLALGYGSALAVWTPAPGPNEAKPMLRLTWYEAYAFCIFDGGFLPTEAEWDYAAAGGDEQRVYPWSNPPTSMLVDPTYAVYDCRADGSDGGYANCALSDIPSVGSRSPKGDGRFGQSDLGGSAIEWVLDWWASPYRYPDCVDCADLTSPGGNRIYRSGSFIDSEAVMLAASHDYYGGPAGRGSGTGVRCARAP